jgi:hypothetical protein
MGYIKDPKGIDFEVIPQTKPDPETDRLVSEFLAKEKLKNRKAKDKMVAKAKEIIQRYEASRALVCLQEPQSGYNKEPIENDLIRQISDLTKEEAKEVSGFIRKLKLKDKNTIY